jgi:hypothetical protein
MFRLYAQRILLANGIDHKLGKRWVQRFLTRHPGLRTLRAKQMDFRRLRCTSDKAVRTYFGRLSEENIRCIPPEYWFNADEIGTSIALGEGTMVIGPANCKTLMRNAPANREWTTVLETIGAKGVVLPPLVIFKG